MDRDSYLTGENAAYLEELLQELHDDPEAIDPATRTALEPLNGTLPQGPTIAPRSIFRARGNGAGAITGAPPTDLASAERQAKVARLINGYRVHGHWAADIDPLDTKEIARHPELDPTFYGLTDADLDAQVSTSPLYGMPPYATVREILVRLRQVYCGTVGVEFMNVLDPEAKRWVLRRFETMVHEPAMDRDTQVRVLQMLTRADGFERFLGTKFIGNKRFSLEGAESLIPLLDLTLTEAGRHGVREVVIGMAHRGRLNVLLNILHKPPAQMLAEFADHSAHDEEAGSGDVKYHLGYSSEHVTPDGDKLHLSLAFNPSHLEAVNPVVEGRVRAKQDRDNDREHVRTMPLLIHGDAAFAGQGLNAEVLNLSALRGYSTGGTIHVVVNNQVGFTTSPGDARSTPYATDVARMLGVPIFHVNGEDPESVARVVTFAAEWRATFRRDVVIDMYCFRKHGHNEMDEPAFTQPLMYQKIAQHPGVREVYLRSLVERGVISRDDADKMMAEFHSELDTALALANVPKAPSPMGGLWAGYHSGRPDVVDTTVPEARLKELLHKLNHVPDDFHPNPKIKRIFKLREEQADLDRPLDWAAGELLAYASLVTQGSPVRISGQDVQRGTFSHRHAVLIDAETGREWAPVANLEAGQAPFECYNSLLSEAGVLGFEYGYSLDYPEALVIWEAQFGDFVNGAQVIIDNFIVSGEAKWNRLTGVVLFLPHGYEGQGPEHSSGRMERFLQSAAQDNMQVVNCTTPAQLFHLLRRQVMRKVRDPLIVFTPKSLLRHPQATSHLSDLTSGGFQSVIPDGAGKKRLVFCSGKVYYDLLEKRATMPESDVALVRVEEIYPFPLAAMQAEMAKHPGASLVWCQEEPKNMGPWPFVALELMEAGIRVEYAGRAASASPATGFHGRHEREQRELVQKALG
ncbi:MAG: 2-oxoglutarate dehydrogenase E1 component [Myxococcota bacterium]